MYQKINYGFDIRCVYKINFAKGVMLEMKSIKNAGYPDEKLDIKLS